MGKGRCAVGKAANTCPQYQRNEIQNLKTEVPYKRVFSPDALKSIDLFARIGGIRLAFQKLGVCNVFSSEWDKFAQKTYAANFGELPEGDIVAIKSEQIPDHDILLAGFPCQAFSQAGLRQVLLIRGTLFEIQRILAAKKPRMFLLENVKQLKGHDKGRTLSTILGILRGEGTEVPRGLQMSEEAATALQSN